MWARDEGGVVGEKGFGRVAWQGVKDKVIGRWKASGKRWEVEHVRFFCVILFSSGYSYIFPNLLSNYD